MNIGVRKLRFKLFFHALSTENGDNLKGMQNRLQEAEKKNSDLLKALNDTIGKLSMLPMGK